MGCQEGSGADASRQDPQITEIEPVCITIAPDHAVGGVTLEIVDGTGAGFATILDPDTALDLATRLVGATARLRGSAR
jgi:hypothetical protein